MGGAAAVRRPAPCGPHCGTITGYTKHNCRCLSAYDAVNAWNVRKRAAVREGTWRPFVDAGPARRHLHKLNELGMSYDMISAQTFLYLRHLQRIGQGVYASVRPATAELILSTSFTVVASDDMSYVPAVGTVRRLQALQLSGWTFKALDDRTDLRGVHLRSVLAQSRVRWATHRAVVSLVDEVRGADPVAAGVRSCDWRRTVARAISLGWVPLDAWVQPIDDPRSQPYKAVVHRRTQQAPAGSRRLAIVEETAHLAAYGAGPEDIAERLGIEWASVLVAHQRAGVPVPGRLVA